MSAPRKFSPAQYFYLHMHCKAPPPECARCPQVRDPSQGKCACALLKRTVSMTAPECKGMDWKRAYGMH